MKCWPGVVSFLSNTSPSDILGSIRSSSAEPSKEGSSCSSLYTFRNPSNAMIDPFARSSVALSFASVLTVV